MSVGSPETDTSEQGSVRVVGTAHISEESAAEVESVIEAEQPDVVAVELDENRYRQFKGKDPEDIDPKELLRGSAAYQFLAYWLLSYVQKRLGDQFDVEPGADMRAGIDAAERIGADVALVDRDIQLTIQRFWAGIGLREKLDLLWELTLAIAGVGGQEAEEFELEELTDNDVVTAMIEEFRQFSPTAAETLIDERDAYIAHNLHDLRAAGLDVVAVVGAGHEAGILEYLESPETLPPKDSLEQRQSKRFSLRKAFGYVLTLGFLLFFALLALSGADQPTLLAVFGAWFLFNGIFAFTLAKLAGAHWTSAGVGGLVAWLTSINPLLAPGWFAGYVELRHTTVNVSDIGRLNEILDDEESPIGDLVSNMLDVGLFRLIVIVALTNVGSMIASVLFPFLVLPHMGEEFESVGAISNAMLAGARNGADILVQALL
ncbi:TraB family protein [Halodesulfurarchaeum formicicum]|uniref:TraB family protein n=1 Tax=Halodesulfurarchaeum formicicum TaxID=1873524 RepID=A0A1D8S3V2_9EURY|nr:TraB/GumN family protein [Halodesulfurarchaeum formicicum]AOW80023.1 TraB family protein [Halodesulfurarchaeum formicicum]